MGYEGTVLIGLTGNLENLSSPSSRMSDADTDVNLRFMCCFGGGWNGEVIGLDHSKIGHCQAQRDGITLAWFRAVLRCTSTENTRAIRWCVYYLCCDCLESKPRVQP